MSIQEKSYKSKKTGKKVTKYYAVVFNSKTQKAEWSKGFDKKSDAKKEEIQMIERIELGAPTPIDLTFKDCAVLWLEASDGIYANSTMRGYLWYLDKYIYPVFASLNIRGITARQIQEYINNLNEIYSAETVNKIINVLSNIFSHAFNLGFVDSNIITNIKRKKVIKKSVITWSEKQINDFLNYDKLKEHQYYNMFLLIFCTGMRPSEVCGIASDDLHGDLLILNNGFDRYGCLSDMKNTRSHRSIKLPKTISTKLNASVQASECGFLFVNNDGRPVNPNAFSKAFKRLLKSYNKEVGSLPDVSLYEAARHSFGTNLIIGHEVPVSIVSSLMGNSERVLQDRYIHVKNDEKAVAIGDYVDRIFA